jgi:hypothetical protein
MNTADPTDQLTQRRLWNARLEKRKHEQAEAARRAATTPATGSYASSCDLSKDLELDSPDSQPVPSDAAQETPSSSNEGAHAPAKRTAAVFSTPRPRFVEAVHPDGSTTAAPVITDTALRPRACEQHPSRRARGMAWAAALGVAAIMAALAIHTTGVLSGHGARAPQRRVAVTTSHEARSTKPLQATLAGVVSGAESIARDAAAQQRRRAAAAKARVRTRARQAAARPRAAGPRGAPRARARSHATPPRYSVSTTATQPVAQPATSGAQTTAPQTTAPASGSTTSSNPPATATSSGSSTHTHTHAFGQGGVLGVGHAG